jgi:hypothetical protein
MAPFGATADFGGQSACTFYLVFKEPVFALFPAAPGGRFSVWGTFQYYPTRSLLSTPARHGPNEGVIGFGLVFREAPSRQK